MSDIRGPVEWWVDVTGLHCPMPVIRCRATLVQMAVCDVLTLRATDRDTRREIAGLVEKSGHQMIAVHERASTVEFVIRKRAPVRGMRMRISSTQDWRAWLGGRLAGFVPAC